VDQVDPRVLAAARRVDLARERGVREPPGLRWLPEERRVEDDPAEQQQPVGERVQARERHVARADHQRQEVVREARHHRHHEQEDHRRAVEREELVVALRRQQVVVRRAELEAHQQRLDAADQEEGERRDDVEDPDLLVVGRGEPLGPPRARGLGLDLVGDHLGHWAQCGSGGGHDRFGIPLVCLVWGRR
jgi:hypothetical protein